MTREEFDKIVAIEKTFLNTFTLPKINSHGTEHLTDINKNHYIFDYQLGENGKFHFEIYLVNAKQKWQLRMDNNPLIRIDVNAPPHMCINTGKVERNHIHIFFPDGIKTYEISNFDDKLYKKLNPLDILMDFFTQLHILFNPTDFQEGI